MKTPKFSDYSVIKRPHLGPVDWQEDQLIECMNCIDDPLYFMRGFMKVQHATLGSLPFIPYPFQIRIIEAFRNNRFCIALTGRQLGKALALHTPLPTPTGWTTMGDVVVGDHLLDETGMPTIVTFATEVMHERDCYEVKFDNDETIIADAEHLWTVGYRKSSHRAATETLSTRDIIPLLLRMQETGHSVYIDNPSPIVGSERELPVPPYTLGLWLGDGNSADGRFCGHKDDCDEMRSFVTADGFLMSAIKADPRNNVRYQTIYGLRGKLVKAGVFNDKHIPDVYLRAPIEARLDLLRGLLDTDGYVMAKGFCNITQKSKRIADGIAELLSGLGIKARRKIKIVHGVDYHVIQFTTVAFDVFRMKRKLLRQGMAKGHSKNTRYFFKSIRKNASVPVRCIQVDSPSSLFLCSRSMIPTHNTTCAAGFLLWKAMFTPDTTILIAANKFVQAIEVMDRIRYAYENMPDHIRAGVIEYNKSTITFDNGSRIISRATSTDTGRGLAITLLYVDEFAYVPPNKAKAFWTSIQPTLSTGGSCIITSTPKSDEDQFAQIWKGATDNVDDYGNLRASGLGRNNFFAIKVQWQEHPDRNEAWAATYREQLGEARFRQEMECSFVTDDETLINPLTLIRLNGIPPAYYTGTVRWFAEPQPNKTYLVGLDPSYGTGNDDAAIQVFQLPEMIHVAEWQHNGTVPRGQVRVLMQTLIYLDSVLRENPEQHNEPDIFWTVENNTLGEAILQIIEDTGEERFPGNFISEKKRKGQVRRFRKGLNTNNKSKLSASARLKSLIESDRMTLNSNNLIKQLKSFVSHGASFAAKQGEHDDLVMALLLVVRMLDSVIGWSGGLHELREYIDDAELMESEPMPMTM